MRLIANKVRVEPRQPGNGLFRLAKIRIIHFNSNRLIANSLRGGYCGSPIHKRIQYDALSKRKQRSNDNPHEMLRLEAGMIGDRLFPIRRATTRNCFDQSVGWVRANGVNRMGTTLTQPFEAVSHDGF